MALKTRTRLEIINKDINAIDTIINCIDKTQRYSAFDTVDDFEKNEMAYDASIRQIEVIGEAVKRLSQELKENHKEIDWKNIAAMRNIMIHQYDKVDSIILWNTVKKELPLEILKLNNIKKELMQKKKELSPRIKRKDGPSLF